MAVFSSHRFLYGESPLNAGKRIWVLSGSHLQDWFFHNPLHGCLSLRRTLELWALEAGCELTVTLRRDGSLDFSGNAEPQSAEQIYSGTIPQRSPRYGWRPGTEGARADAPPGDDGTEATQTRAASATRQASGGGGQALINVLKRLTQFLHSPHVRGLVIVEDLGFILRGLSLNPENHPAIHEIRNIVRSDWHQFIDAGKLLVFLAPDQNEVEELLPRKNSPKVEWKQVLRPSENEIVAALERLTLRCVAELTGIKALARILADQEETLELALSKVLNLINRGDLDVTAGKILNLPPLNEEAIADVKAELNQLVGLDDLKAKVEAIEQKARNMRENLLEGGSLPQDESMHLVFTGPPGTGKTTAAAIVARLFNSLGLLRKSEPRTVVASEILSSNREESGENMRCLLNEARGGTLFIDEAHQLGDRDSMGASEAIKVLVPLSLNYRRELVLILAGYDEKMHELFAMDPGMPRRFPEHGRVHFRDYTQDELWEILTRDIARRNFTVDPELVPRLRSLLARRSRLPSFGNAGGVGNLVEEILERQSLRRRFDGDRVIVAEDLPPLIRRNPQLMREAFAQLDAMAGLGPVKRCLRDLIDSIEYDLREEEEGTGSGEVNVMPGNMRFVGPPGTGKTTVARLMAKLLHGIGCIEKPVCVEMSPGSLRGRYQGWTGDIVRRRINDARDGVFFIDEAYGLVRGEHDSYGQEAVEELVQQITRPENQGTVFIIAGYRNRIDTFVAANEGLARRFPREVIFPNFSANECAALAIGILEKKRFGHEEAVVGAIRALAEREAQAMGESFGNAGWVESLVGSILAKLKSRVIRERLPHGTAQSRRVLMTDLPGQEGTGAGDPGAQSPVERCPWPRPCVPLPLRRTDALAARTEAGDLITLLERAAFQVLTTEAGGCGNATGFFVSPDGLLATCAHVIRGSLSISVLCGEGRTPLPARPVAVDDDLDLALLAVDCQTPVDFLILGESLRLTPLAELVVYGNAHVLPGEPGRVVTAKVSRNDVNNQRDFECDGGIEGGYSGGPVLEVISGTVAGIVSGGQGEYTKRMIRADQLRSMLEELGYAFAAENDLSEGLDGDTGN